MDLVDVLDRMDPLARNAVALVYFERHSVIDAARLLEVEQVAVAAALAQAFRGIARWLTADEDDHPATCSCRPPRSGGVGRDPQSRTGSAAGAGAPTSYAERACASPAGGPETRRVG